MASDAKRLKFGLNFPHKATVINCQPMAITLKLFRKISVKVKARKDT